MLTHEQVVPYVQRMQLMIPFFPEGDKGAAQVGVELMEFVDAEDRLAWLTQQAIRSMRKWAGIAELRAIYGTRYQLADGSNPGRSLTAGFRLGDLEADYQRRLAEEAGANLERWKQEQKLIGEAPEPFQISGGLKQVDPPRPTPPDPPVPARRDWKTLAEREAELAAAPRRKLSEAEKRRRLRELEQRLGIPANPPEPPSES